MTRNWCRFSLLVVLGLLAAAVNAQEAPAIGETAAVRGSLAGPGLERATAAARPGPAEPPAMVAADRIEPFRDLASRLSSDRGWLQGGALKALAEQRRWLNEVFDGAPRLLAVEGRYYRVVLELHGDAWKRFDPAIDPYFVYLTHEIDDQLGPDRVLGFQDGKPSAWTTRDLETIAGVGVSLRELTADESLRPAARQQAGADDRDVLALGGRIPLGAPRPRPLERTPPALPADLTKATCPRQLAPTSCSAGKPACGTAGYSPFFVLDALQIKEDHEGPFSSPEIELYPMRLDINSAAGGSNNVNTGMIFSGRTILDFAGQTVYLPDVESKNTWYTITGGMALFPTNNGTQFSGTLVEDDNTAGRLITDGNQIHSIAIVSGLNSIIHSVKKFDLFSLITGVLSLVDVLGVLSNDDDLYSESLGVTNDLFCNDILGQAFPYNVTVTGTEWALKGHFACINPSCTPPPPPPPCTPSGGSCTSGSSCCTGFCDLSGGVFMGVCG